MGHLSVEMVVYRTCHALANCSALSLQVGVSVDDDCQLVMGLDPSLEVLVIVSDPTCRTETSPDHHVLEANGAVEEISAVLYSYLPPHLCRLDSLNDVWESGSLVERC